MLVNFFCHQHISSPTTVTNIDLTATNLQNLTKKNRYWKLVKNDSDDISSDFQYFHFFIFRRKNSKIRKHVLKILQFFIIKFPSTQSKTFF